MRSALLMLCLAITACSGKKEDIKPGGQGSGDDSEGSSDIARPAHEGEKVTEFDLNHDRKPDVWSYTVESPGEDGKIIDRLVRKDLDINWDGKIDIARVYGAKEQIEKEAMDLDFDGKIDQTNYYEKGAIVRKERDLDYNGNVDLWIFFEKGKIARKERDRSGDGKVDYWEYWEGDQVDRVGEDQNGDGTVDRWTKNPNSES
jgi:hypothetical protein